MSEELYLRGGGKSVLDNLLLYNGIAKDETGLFTYSGSAWGGWVVSGSAIFSNNETSYGISPITQLMDYGVLLGFAFDLPKDGYPLNNKCLNLRTYQQTSYGENINLGTIPGSTTSHNRIHLRFLSDTSWQLGTSINNQNKVWAAAQTLSGYTRSSIIQPYWIVNKGFSIRITD